MVRAINWKIIFFAILLPCCHGSFGRHLYKGVSERGSNVGAWQQMAKIASDYGDSMIHFVIILRTKNFFFLMKIKFLRTKNKLLREYPNNPGLLNNKGALFENKHSLLWVGCFTLSNSAVTAGYLFPRWERFIPRLGMFCSQGGNNSSTRSPILVLTRNEYRTIRAE